MAWLRRAPWVFLTWAWISSVGLAADPFWGADPAWSLIHEPAVEDELKLSAAERREFRRLLDSLDARVFPLRNKPAAEAAAGVDKALAELDERLRALLDDAGFRRWGEIRCRQRGPAALLAPPLAGRMDYTPRQRERIEAIVTETVAATKSLERRVAEGEPAAPLEKRYTDLKKEELTKVGGVLTSSQKSIWGRALGRPFDLTRLGQARYRAPELVDSGDWLHTEPLTLESMRGSVVVIHFYAFGCINCVRNHPTYVDWQERFRDRGVVILGIHTPETAAEEDSAKVREKAAEAGFTFPILIDRTKANWNAWGNSMWPSVYLVDKRGDLRSFWPGELQWKGATGDVWMRERIEELLAEPVSPAP